MGGGQDPGRDRWLHARMPRARGGYIHLRGRVVPPPPPPPGGGGGIGSSSSLEVICAGTSLTLEQLNANLALSQPSRPKNALLPCDGANLKGKGGIFRYHVRNLSPYFGHTAMLAWIACHAKNLNRVETVPNKHLT